MTSSFVMPSSMRDSRTAKRRDMQSASDRPRVQGAARDTLPDLQYDEPAVLTDPDTVERLVIQAVNHFQASRPESTRRTSRLIKLQEWEGVVDEVCDGVIRARLFDKTVPTNPNEIAEFEIEDVTPSDRELISPGAVFYWTIGYLEDPTRRKTSSIKFRRLPVWSRQDIDRVEETAKQLRDYFLGSSDIASTA